MGQSRNTRDKKNREVENYKVIDKADKHHDEDLNECKGKTFGGIIGGEA